MNPHDARLKGRHTYKVLSEFYLQCRGLEGPPRAYSSQLAACCKPQSIPHRARQFGNQHGRVGEPSSTRVRQFQSFTAARRIHPFNGTNING
jgi:hypothetical protein